MQNTPWSTDSSYFCAPDGKYVRTKIDGKQRTMYSSMFTQFVNSAQWAWASSVVSLIEVSNRAGQGGRGEVLKLAAGPDRVVEEGRWTECRKLASSTRWHWCFMLKLTTMCTNTDLPNFNVNTFLKSVSPSKSRVTYDLDTDTTTHKIIGIVGSPLYLATPVSTTLPKSHLAL